MRAIEVPRCSGPELRSSAAKGHKGAESGMTGAGTVSNRPVLLPETCPSSLCTLSRPFHLGVRAKHHCGRNATTAVRPTHREKSEPRSCDASAVKKQVPREAERAYFSWHPACLGWRAGLTEAGVENAAPDGACNSTSLAPLGWWSRQESNLRPSHCERDALPTELRPRPNCGAHYANDFWRGKTLVT